LGKVEFSFAGKTLFISMTALAIFFGKFLANAMPHEATGLLRTKKRFQKTGAADELQSARKPD
jgi:hypothetical protein